METLKGQHYQPTQCNSLSWYNVQGLTESNHKYSQMILHYGLTHLNVQMLTVPLGLINLTSLPLPS